jgi:hypothetical protein
VEGLGQGHWVIGALSLEGIRVDHFVPWLVPVRMVVVQQGYPKGLEFLLMANFLFTSLLCCEQPGALSGMQVQCYLDLLASRIIS